MAKKTRTQYISKGIVGRSLRGSKNRREYNTSIDRVVNQTAAAARGKRVIMTIDNPNKSETREREIRVLVDENMSPVMKNGKLVRV